MIIFSTRSMHNITQLPFRDEAFRWVPAWYFYVPCQRIGIFSNIVLAPSSGGNQEYWQLSIMFGHQWGPIANNSNRSDKFLALESFFTSMCYLSRAFPIPQ